MIKKLIKVCLFLSLFAISTAVAAQKNYTALVNPFIGTGGHGHTYPGASMPFGMMQLSPDTRLEGWDGCSGYHYSDSLIYGFSHTHLSGTGIPDYCDILLMPFTGSVEWENSKYASSFSHKTERASPGYYEVKLDKHKIRAQLSTSYRSGMHQYHYPDGTETGSVLIDLVHRDQVLDSYIEKVSETELRGYRRSKSWAKDQIVYFYLKFDQPILAFLVQDRDAVGRKGPDTASGKNIKAMISFDLRRNAVLKIKAGISGVSMDGAKKNLDTEIAGWDFEEVHKLAQQAWNAELGKIDVKGGTASQQTVFYTALYHCMLAPNLYTDVDGKYRGTNLQVQQADGFSNYSVFSLWDTYRAFHPLMTILDQKRTGDWIRTFLVQYQNGGMLPVWELSGNETFCMIGYHSVPVIADAYQKGIRGFDEKLALQAMRSYAESDRFGLAHYQEMGYLSNEKEHESVSKTLEYAYDDWCIAQFAKMSGQEQHYLEYLQRAQSYKNLFDPSTGHMRGKVQSIWYSPFDAREVNNFYTEGNSWQYSFAVPQDVEGLIRLMGGKNAFANKLNKLFRTAPKLTGRVQPDVTGLIGQYAHGNEPSHHMAYMFQYAGMPWRTEELVHKICNEFYRNAPDGLIGNEDCGQMSAWYVLSAMGFYPVCPGDGQYVLGTPVFDEVVIRLENGKTFRIAAQKKSAKDFYVQSVLLNGKKQSRSFILHTDLMQGGELLFHLGPKAAMPQAGTAGVPPSAIREQLIVPVPYFVNSKNKFSSSMAVKLASADRQARIFYRIMRPDVRSVFVLYDRPFLIQENTVVEAYAEKNAVRSKTISQQFIRIPSDRSIKVFSKVHPMYTAGGPGALIDGITGTENWRAGDWQSYYGSDFEAVIDLKKARPLSYLAVHVLQDVSPWILYPSDVIFETSMDGKNYKESGRIRNERSASEEQTGTQELGMECNLLARYIRVKARSGGPLPSWHESAGSPSHLFIDEVIIR